MTPASAPYRDERRDLSADVAKRRAVQLRDELVVVVRLARVMAHDVLVAQAAVNHERSDLAKAEHPFAFLRWWWRSQWMLPWRDPDPDAARIAHERIDVASAEAQAAIVAELAAITGGRVATLREHIAIADVRSAGATARDDVFDDALDAAVDHAGLCDTLALAVELRRAIDAADVAASDAVSDALRAVLEGRDAAAHAKTSSFVRAQRGLAYTRIHLELVLASLIALRGPDDPTVVQLATIVRELRLPADAPDEEWRRGVAADRDRVTAVLADLERQLAR